MTRLIAALTALMIAAAALPAMAGELRLIFVRSDSCHWCALWEAEIAPAYPTRPEGRAAPLMRVDIDGPWPDGLALARRAWVTPTFILTRDGMETARIEGYPGAARFWQVLAGMIGDARG
ncbi:MAG: SoxS protein [Paracoccus sp. (in: a-proteobacteria)]|nr:SoxS protein [Paracoccus sp. (in: a-proteobacteria)]